MLPVFAESTETVGILATLVAAMGGALVYLAKSLADKIGSKLDAITEQLRAGAETHAAILHKLEEHICDDDRHIS